VEGLSVSGADVDGDDVLDGAAVVSGDEVGDAVTASMA